MTSAERLANTRKQESPQSNIKDQTSSKHCGHIAGKQIVSRERARSRFEVAVDATQNHRLGGRRLIEDLDRSSEQGDPGRLRLPRSRDVAYSQEVR
ncbi:MAG: hypothetical protein J07HQW2_00632 [Haloquadratum walsbyi J07HQW2]|uniref:Uncharacterized protein n=1 Tax=Haloquadratum walsbyi J07HQW2 TaxID=1238425 RepID=U1NBZ3_9EURY|nr:MAG: hypothetical protein J07HQW2_00632 [Haloquadratum walsbyi J07HQW2]